MTHILGINSAYHESSACLIKDGKIIAFAEEERFNRRKHAKHAKVDNPDELPINSIDFCLKMGGISLDDVDYIAKSFMPAKRLRNKEFDEDVIEGSWGSASGEDLFYRKLIGIPGKLSEIYGADVAKKFRWIDHHISHASSAFFVSPFDEAAILVADGIGEIESTTMHIGKGNKLARLKTINYPHSIGFLWEKFSRFLGFTEYDACKVMGLASYGDAKKYYEHFRRFVKINEKGFDIDHKIVKFRTDDFNSIEELFGKRRKENEKIEKRHADIAAALQKITEEILLRIAQDLSKKTKTKNLCFAGGVALNCVANKVLKEKGPFENIYIQPVAYDAGTAIGAAYFIWHQQLGNPRSFVMDHVYFGPEYSDEDVLEALKEKNLKYIKCKNPEKVAAKLISDGKILGWFQGRMEAGPRALGNRSIVADPRRKEIKDILNAKIKHREYFRPFAPSVLAEKAHEWFAIKKGSLSSDFMLFAYDVNEDKKKYIPAVIHVDGTSRIQTVRKETNPRYYKLIKEFEKLTGIPILLNTSFNDMEPIVCSPKDAINTFIRTSIDYLVMGNVLVFHGDKDG